MPQMAPMNWTLLYFFFLLLFFLMIILNYYMFLYHPKLYKILKMKKTINWKW